MQKETELHPLARASLRSLTLMDPVLRYRPGVTERMFTNPCAPDFGLYPCPARMDLQDRFASFVQDTLVRSAQVLTGTNVLFTPGSTTAIDLLIRTFCEPGRDTIAVCKPTFPVYRHYATAYDIEVLEAPLHGEGKDGLDVNALAATRAKLIFVCRPSWPLGSMISLDGIRDLSNRVEGLVAIDEAYIEFSGSQSAAKLIEERRNLVVLRTFSKAWGLAGLRAGALVGPEQLLYAVRLVLEPFSFGSVVQEQLDKRMQHLNWVRTAVEFVCGERDRLTRELAELEIVDLVYPSYANFLCARLKSTRGFAELCSRQGLLANDMSRFVENTIRISIATREENDRVLAALLSLSQTETEASQAAAV